MASLGGALANRVLAHSEAEKALRPWWDNLEDYLVYGLIMLGLVVSPTALFNMGALDCNYCQSDELCPDELFEDWLYTGSQEEEEKPAVGADPGKFSSMWVKKYCTSTAVDGFVLYFPYILLLIPTSILLTEKFFIRLFGTSAKLEAFYNMLVKEPLSRDEEASKAHFEAAADAKEDKKSKVEAASPETKAEAALENSKTLFEISNGFAENSNYYFSYLIRTVVELILAVALLVWLVVLGVHSWQKDEYIYCKVHGFKFECAGLPTEFYMYVLVLTLVLLSFYLLCCAYNLSWLLYPSMGVLSNVMIKYRKFIRHSERETRDDVLLGDLQLIYYHNRDLKLMLDLLAEGSGLAFAVKVMCLLDRKFRLNAKVADMKVERVDEEEEEQKSLGGDEGVAVRVSFEDAKILKNIFASMRKVKCFYTVEVRPATLKGPRVKAVAFTSGSNVYKFKEPAAADGDKEPLGDGDAEAAAGPGERRALPFTGLDPTVRYTFRVCTVVDGWVVSKRASSIGPMLASQEE